MDLENLLGWALLPLGGCLGGLICIAATAAWKRLRSVPPADYTLTLSDPDGIPIRQHRMTAAEAGRMITALNSRQRFEP